MMFASMIESVIMPRLGTGVYELSPLTEAPHPSGAALDAPLPLCGRGRDPSHERWEGEGGSAPGPQASCTCSTVGASPDTVVRRTSRLLLSSKRRIRCIVW